MKLCDKGTYIPWWAMPRVTDITNQDPAARICGLATYLTGSYFNGNAKNRKNVGDRNEKEVAIHRLIVRLLINLM